MLSINRKKLYAAVMSTVLAASFSTSAFAEEEADLSEFALDTMVVTANRVLTKITDAKADISVVDRKAIEEMHMTNVEEALRIVPGVQFLNNGGSGALNANLNGIRINGSKEIVVLVDGVRVTDFQGDGSGYIYASLMNNMDNVERVEVLRGSAGTVYGSGAKGGVINIITRKINEAKTTVDVSGGTFGKQHYKLNTMGRQDKVGYNVYYDKTKSGDVKDGEGKKWPSSLDSQALGLKVTYDFTNDHTLTMSYDRNKADYSGFDLVEGKTYEGNNKSDNFTLKDDIKFSDKWSNSFSYRHSNTKGNYAQSNHWIESAQSDYTYNFINEQARYTMSRHDFVFGIDYSEGKNNISQKLSSASTEKGNFKLKNTSYYIQDDWEVIPKVTLSGGLRYDKPTNSSGNGVQLDTHTSKSYKISWDVTDNDTIYAGKSDFYILPSMHQLLDKNYGNKGLKAAEGHTNSIGYNKTFDDNNILTLNWFETISDVAIGLPVSGGYNNYTDGIARGWNMQYMTQISENWNANIGWAHLFQHCSGDNLDMGYYPKDMATFSIFYNYAKVKAGLDGYYFMRKINNEYAGKNGWPADNYAVVNLSASYAPTKDLNIYFKVDNLFDKLYAEHTDNIHSGKGWYSMPGRSFVLGMQFTF